MDKNLESPLDYKEFQPVHPKGDQSWVFIGMTDAEAETPILWWQWCGPPQSSFAEAEGFGRTRNGMLHRFF